MKPPPFEYHMPRSLAEALALLAEHGEDARVLAGGQSLVPMLSLRLCRPAHLIDVNHVTELSHVTTRGRGLTIGAMTRQRTAERSDIVRERCPLLKEAVSLIGHPSIRNRGTIGGSIGHADPAAELPAVAMALDAEVIATSTRGDRRIAAPDFFLGYYTTALEPDECLVQLDLPPWPPGTGWSFKEMARRHGDFAMVGVAATLQLDDANRVVDSRITLTGVAEAPVRAREAESALVGEDAEHQAFVAAGESAATGIDPVSDVHASGAYRRHAVRIFVRRALETAARRAGGGR